MHPTNDHRANRLRAALRRYGTDDTVTGSLTELLADARHWCNRHGESFAELDRRATCSTSPSSRIPGVSRET